MSVTVVVGGFFGDEGKGKIVSYIALKDQVGIVARGGVGPNAGHTVMFRGRTYKLRQLPSGFVNEKARLMLGPGVLVSPEILLKEVEETKSGGRVFVDPNAGIIEERHVKEDKGSEHLSRKIGTTGTGCGPAQRDRVMRVLKTAKEVEELKDMLLDVPLAVNEAIDSGERVLLEGTQGTSVSYTHLTLPTN